jgi:hypothetical protein
MAPHRTLPISTAFRVVRSALLAAALSLAIVGLTASQETALLYPDLRPLPSPFVLVDFVTINGETHYVLRFDATIWNAGQGPLELHGDSTPEHAAFQRIYNATGGSIDRSVVGGFVFFEPHQHWHFENFAEYQLWPKDDFDRWLATGRQQGQPQWQGSKTTGQDESFCIRDTDQVDSLAGSPAAPTYNVCNQDLQGISVGWGDTYPLSLPEQWIDLGAADLPDGVYVLRVVADPLRVLDQGTRDDAAPTANEALTVFARSALATQVLPDPYTPNP